MFRHATRVHFPRGCVERRPRCTSYLHGPRRLHVVHVGLDWLVQGAWTHRERGVERTIRPLAAQTLAVLQAGFKSASDYETFVWVREEDLPEINENIQVKEHRDTRATVRQTCETSHQNVCCGLQLTVDKDEIPLLGGEYVLGYYSTNMQSLIGLSANFQVSPDNWLLFLSST